jgi:hypothetical protein
VFVHVPKTGGVSVSRALFGADALGHRTVAKYKEILGPIAYRRSFSFAFVRNPYSRLVSAYTFLKGGGFHARNAAWAAENLASYESFADFVTEWLTPETMAEIPHFRPQVYFVCDGGEQPAVDFIGRFENLERDFAHVARTLGVDVVLPHANATGRARPYKDFYTPEVQEKVARLYARDFSVLGYDPLTL